VTRSLSVQRSITAVLILSSPGLIMEQERECILVVTPRP
jgi:hypothetical protein